MAEWLTRLPAKQILFEGAGSNPAGDVFFQKLTTSMSTWNELGLRAKGSKGEECCTGERRGRSFFIA